MKPLDLFDTISPPPEFSDEEVKEALSDMFENREIELTSDRYVKFRLTT
jgi:hypothetical protein